MQEETAFLRIKSVSIILVQANCIELALFGLFEGFSPRGERLLPLLLQALIRRGRLGRRPTLISDKIQ